MLVLSGTLVAASSLHAVGTPPVPARQSESIWDGIYTEEQAGRGEAVYTETCAACHSPDLMGGEMSPALSGGQFASNWDSLSVGELFERTRVSMPATAPGGLSRQEYADVLAYIFSKGGFPPGQTELSTRTEMLNQIQFEAFKP